MPAGEDSRKKAKTLKKKANADDDKPSGLKSKDSNKKYTPVERKVKEQKQLVKGKEFSASVKKDYTGKSKLSRVDSDDDDDGKYGGKTASVKRNVNVKNVDKEVSWKSDRNSKFGHTYNRNIKRSLQNDDDDDDDDDEDDDDEDDDRDVKRRGPKAKVGKKEQQKNKNSNSHINNDDDEDSDDDNDDEDEDDDDDDDDGEDNSIFGRIKRMFTGNE